MAATEGPVGPAGSSKADLAPENCPQWGQGAGPSYPHSD